MSFVRGLRAAVSFRVPIPIRRKGKDDSRMIPHFFDPAVPTPNAAMVLEAIFDTVVNVLGSFVGVVLSH